jgi:putative transposase
LRPAEKRELVCFAHDEHGLSVSKACSALRLSRTVFAYRPSPRDDMPLITALLELVEKYPRYGFGKYFSLLRRDGHRWNHKRILRVYRQLDLHLRRKGKRRLPTRAPVRLEAQARVNLCWSIDFMSDCLYSGQRFRTFNVLDDCSREALALEVDTNLPAARVIRVLERLAAWRGYPAKLRLDNGPEFVSVQLADWAERHGVRLEFIQPGKPMQNSYVERFNRTFREEVLNFYVFNSLNEVRDITERWLKEYNEQRPHESLGNLTPQEFALKHTEFSGFELH